ncbi:MAG TPA: DUF364 domain-containing protein [Deltaproteobacteria bacterium]|nr:DUF364 domain-containing protein [Deltaproteobacteria bacterium]
MPKTNGKWAIYEQLIAGIPEQSVIEDCLVGLRWILVRSGGVGMALTPPEGDRRAAWSGPFTGRPTREVACLAKSWNPLEAAVGVAALNSHYNAPAVFSRTWETSLDDQPHGNAFEHYRDRLKNKKVAVIGHFPGLEDLASQCELSILERRPGLGDLPDPAAEYILPLQDAVFITATTLINKTLPRLLELSSGRFCVLVGPSTPLTPALFDFGVKALAGTVVVDEAKVWRHVAEGGERSVFANGARMVKCEPTMMRAHQG